MQGYQRRLIKLRNFIVQVTQNCGFSWFINQGNYINRYPWSLALVICRTFKMGRFRLNLNYVGRNLIFHLPAEVNRLQQIKLRFASVQNILSIIVGSLSNICKFIIKIADSTKTSIFSIAISKNIFNFWWLKRCNC